MRTQMVFGALAVLAALAAPARAAQDIPDPTAQREFGAKLGVCNVCHGANGVPKSGNIPVIWGQQENYLVKQLHDFRTGDRNVEVMKWMSETLTDAEQTPTAVNFAKQKWPARSAAAAAARNRCLPELSCRELPGRRAGRRGGDTASGGTKLRLSGGVDAPLCRWRAHQQCRHDADHEGDFADRSRGNGALSFQPLIAIGDCADAP
jgi:cytochrome c553